MSLTGAAANLLLGAIELLDLNIQLTPVFRSPAERAIFATYFSLNLIVGSAIGLVVGLFGVVGSRLRLLIEKRLARGRYATLAHRAGAGVALAFAAGLVLNFQPGIRAYVSGLIIEAQKLPYVYGRLLRLSAYLTPLIIILLLVGCWIAWSTARTGPRLNALPRVGLHLLWLVLMAAAYYVDSRVEVQLYEYTLHRSMFLLAQGAAMALVASAYLSWPIVRSWARVRYTRRARISITAAVVAILAGGAFTFFHFGRNQNLKTQLCTRTTQAKQHFKLAQWALDFDRDGYSALLGGDDADDTAADINPDQNEIAGDGIDNNQIGGDLTPELIDNWHMSLRELHGEATALRRLNLVYIFIDAVRADHVGAYGYKRNTTRNLDNLAARSTVFENAFSPSANTFESAARFMKSSYWDAEVEAWSQILANNGYDVVLFPQNRLPMLRRYVKGARVAPNSRTRQLETSVDVIIETLGRAGGDRPFCAYVYAVDPHRPYAPHKEFDFGSTAVDLYDGELAFTDHHLGRLLDWLETSGRMDDTMVVVMADHAESFGERAVYRHSSQLYNDQTHVPMIFYVPGIAPRRVPDYVTTVDLGTTILDALGIPRPEKYTGVSLLPLMRGEPLAHPSIYGEQTLREKEFPNIRPDQYPQPVNKKYMVVTRDGYKLIYNRNAQTFELFDLTTDPKELRNLYDYRRDKAAELLADLGRFIDVVSSSRPANADEAKYRFDGETVDDR